MKFCTRYVDDAVDIIPLLKYGDLFLFGNECEIFSSYVSIIEVLFTYFNE